MVNGFPNDVMGYDRAITMFSPDGRLLQVEYAKETVNKGTPAVGVTFKEGVVLIADKVLFEKLVIPNSVEKIMPIDRHISAAMSGLVSDGRILVEHAQVAAQNHRTTYDEDVDIKSVVKDICNQMQAFTQYGGMRPYGVSFLIAGYDDKPHLFITEVSGVYFEFKAGAIGENSKKIIEYFNKNYKDGLTKNEAISLAVEALKNALNSNFKIDRLEGVIIEKSDKTFKPINMKDFKGKDSKE
ncbi:Proteasome subunit alpha [Candidatus Tiddalikarchaeum anstoanum]|nr:Proteasome subunit alpha [Candidatus Tiddalikarchaeum anstoanum]